MMNKILVRDLDRSTKQVRFRSSASGLPRFVISYTFSRTLIAFKDWEEHLGDADCIRLREVSYLNDVQRPFQLRNFDWQMPTAAFFVIIFMLLLLRAVNSLLNLVEHLAL